MREQIEQIENFYREALQTLDGKRETPEIEVRFYPYIGINHTIRLRDKKVFVRLAEVCRALLPPHAQRALAFILVAKLLRKKVSPQALEIYRGFLNNQELREQVTANKRARGRKIITTATGEFYDLRENSYL